MAKLDFRSVFRVLGMKVSCFKLLVMKAQSPIDGKMYYFVNKCLPFGALISCSHFQRVLNAIAFILTKRTGKPVINYLDDYFFTALTALLCDGQVEKFLELCDEIKFPVSMEKTFWSTTIIIFLGFLINSEMETISVPCDKIDGAISQIDEILAKRKTTVLKLQKLCGILNFICRCIVLGRAFTRRLYFQFSTKLWPYHHINMNSEIRGDLEVWKKFLTHPSVYCQPFIDFNGILSADVLDWHTDASGSIGFGGHFGNCWFSGYWSVEFLAKEPSIEFQELFAVTASVLLWGHHFHNKRICLYCDNQAVVHMLNSSTSNCKNCMGLIRRITLYSLIVNLRAFARFSNTKSNFLADSLSHGQMARFWKLANRNRRMMDVEGHQVPLELLPITSYWID